MRVGGCTCDDGFRWLRRAWRRCPQRPLTGYACDAPRLLMPVATTGGARSLPLGGPLRNRGAHCAVAHVGAPVPLHTSELFGDLVLARVERFGGRMLPPPCTLLRLAVLRPGDSPRCSSPPPSGGATSSGAPAARTTSCSALDIPARSYACCSRVFAREFSTVLVCRLASWLEACCSTAAIHHEPLVVSRRWGRAV